MCDDVSLANKSVSRKQQHRARAVQTGVEVWQVRDVIRHGPQRGTKRTIIELGCEIKSLVFFVLLCGYPFWRPWRGRRAVLRGPWHPATAVPAHASSPPPIRCEPERRWLSSRRVRADALLL